MSTNYVTAVTVTIASGASLSSAAELDGTLLASVTIPSGFTGTTVTFEASADGSTYAPLKKEDGTTFSLTVSGLTFTSVDPSYFVGAPYIKVRAGTSASPSVQTADRSIVLGAREL